MKQASVNFFLFFLFFVLFLSCKPSKYRPSSAIVVIILFVVVPMYTVKQNY